MRGFFKDYVLLMEMVEKNVKIYTIDAYEVAKQTGMGRRINTVMQVCFFALAKIMETDEAIKLGILETDPEDFALCSFACPSKVDLVGIIRKGLDLIQEEGI